MNAKISYFNFTIFKKNLTLFCPVWILYFLTLFLMMPFSIWATVRQAVKYQESYSFSASDLTHTVNTSLMDGSVSSLSIVFQAVYALICAGIVFRYLYTSRSAGMIHALPLKRICLYISNVLSGLAMIIVPQVVVTLLTVAVLAATGYGNYSCLFSAFAVTAGYSLFFYSLAIFCAMLVGHILALPALFGFFNFFVLITEYIIRGIMSMLLFGYTFDSQMTLSFLSPIIYLCNNVHTMTDKQMPYFSSSAFLCIGIYAAVGILLILFSYLLYKKRKTETSGDPIAIKKLQPILKIAFSFITSCVISFIIYSAFTQEHYTDFKGFIFIFILLVMSGFVCSYAYEMILNKSFKVLKKGLPGALLYCAIISVTLVIIKTDLFGFVTKVPQAVDIKQINISDNGSNIITSDPGAIKTLTDIHQLIIKDKDSIIDKVNHTYQNQDSNDYIYNITATYELRNGKKLVRQYAVPYTSDTAKNPSTYIGKINEFFNTPKYIMDSLAYLDSQNIKIETIDINPYSMNHSASEDNEEAAIQEANDYFTVAESDIPKFYQALKDDIKFGHVKSRVDDNSNPKKPLYIINMWYLNHSDRTFYDSNYSFTFYITEDCENVIHTIKSLASVY